MGIDNESVLVFGILFDYNKLIEIGNIEESEEILDDIQMETVGKFSELFPDLYIGNTSPYYNSDAEEWEFFISLVDPSSNYSLDDLIEIRENKIKSYMKCLERYGIEYEDPLIISLPDVR